MAQLPKLQVRWLPVDQPPPATRDVRTADPSAADMELGHWVIGSMGDLGHLSRPGHRVIILSWCETRVFPVFEKKLKIKIYFFVKIHPTVINI